MRGAYQNNTERNEKGMVRMLRKKEREKTEQYLERGKQAHVFEQTE